MKLLRNKAVFTFLIGYAIVLFVGLVFLFIYAKGDFVLFMNNKASEFYDSFFMFITLLGLGGVFVLPILFALFVRYSYAIAGVIALALTGLFTYLFKQVLFNGMPRPTAFFKNNELQHFIEGFEYHGHNSFPSGHTMTAFALVLFVAIIVNRKAWSIPLLILGVLIGVSRVYLLQHFLMDIVAGSFLGVICTILGFWISTNGLERKFPSLSKSMSFKKAEVKSENK